MSRIPNPWIALPVLTAAIAGAVIGFLVTDASCAPSNCTGAAIAVAVVAAATVGIGVGVVAVLAVRSIGEHREYQAMAETAPILEEPPAETEPPTC